MNPNRPKAVERAGAYQTPDEIMWIRPSFTMASAVKNPVLPCAWQAQTTALQSDPRRSETPPAKNS